MGAPDLRPYQRDVVERLATTAHRRPLLVAPTGAGKTVIAAEMIRRARGPVLFLAHRRELISQASRKLFDQGVDFGIIQAGSNARPGQRVQVASVQTLWSRAMRSTVMDLPPADLVIVDEAHRGRARTYRKILDSYPAATIMGLTATPCRGDGRGLGSVFDGLVECPSVRELIGLGFLVPTRVYAPSRPDLTGVRTAQGDYVATQLAERMDKAQLVGDIVEHWHKLAERRKTVVFASSVAHSVHLRDEFRRAGVWAEHIDGSTPVDERDQILQRLAEGEIEVVTNFGVLTEGWDCPAASCCVLARPTKHLGLYRQMAGRVLRPFEDKADALILDHAGAVFTHGFVEDDIQWTLAEDRRAENRAIGGRRGVTGRDLATCPECAAVRWSGQPCASCGWRPRPKPRSVDVADGELAQVERDRRIKANQPTAGDKRIFHCQLLYIGRERGYKDGWAAHKYREKFGDWPADRFAAPMEPSPAVRAWVRSRQIAYAKAMEKAGAA